MIKHALTTNIEAPTKAVAETKKKHLEQLSTLDATTLEILAKKSKKKGIAQKLRRFQHLI